MKKNLFFLLAIIFAIQGYGQTVQTSFGTGTNSYIPIYTFYGYNYSQHIVTNAELVAGGLGTTYGQIVKIRWHWNGTGLFTNCVDWKIYIGHTTKTSFTSTTDWVPLTGLTLVYDSLLTIPTAAGWFEFTLQTPFTYDGTSNLVIAVDENTPNYSTTANYTSFTASSTRGIYYYNDSTNPDPASPPTGTLTSNLPNVQLYFMETCPAPVNITAPTITDNSATISWTPFGTATVFNLEYKEQSATTWTLVTGLTTTSYTIPSLTANTTYQVRLQADCISETSNFSMPFTFTTSLIPVNLPYFNDFENPATYTDIALVNGSQINQWVISNTAGVNATTGGEYALHITNNTATNAWAYTPGTGSNASRVYAMMDVVVPAGVNELKLDFDWIANGSSAANEFLRVYWLPTNIPITAGQIPPTVASVNYDLTAMIGNYTGGYGSHWLSRQTTWQHAQFSINSTQFPTLAGNTWRLLIHWRNDQSIADQPPATVDNISIVVSNCPTPTIPIVSNITSNSVDLAWTENGSATTWNVSYKPVTETVWTTIQATTNPYTLSGLNTATAYNIRLNADCGTEVSSWSPITTTMTACGTISQFPWSESFEYPNAAWPAAVAPGNAVAPTCWLNINGASTSGLWRRTTTASYIRTGIASAQQYSGGTTAANSDYLITPPITLTGNERIRFWVKGYSTYVEKFSVAIYDITTAGQDITSMADTTLFVTIMPTTTANNNNWVEYEIFLNQFVGDYRIAFIRNTTQGYYLNLDDILIDEIPTCMRPTAITVTDINSYDATISWTATDPSQTTWYLYYKPSTAADWDSVQVYATTHTLTNLTDNTLYQYYLKTDCGTELSEATNMATFRTACAPFTTLPYVETFDTYGTGSGIFPPCWNYLTTYSSAPYISTTNYSPPGSIYAYLSSGQYTILIAPLPDATINVSDLQVKFYVRGPASQNIQVGIIEDINNAATFVPVQTIPITATFTQYTAFLSNYTGTGNRIAFKFAPTASGAHYFDNVEIDLAPTCLPVNNLNVSYISGSSAYVTWSPNGAPDYFTVAVSELGLESWTNYTTTDPNYVLTGLNQQTAYTVKVYPNCQGFDGPADTMNFVTTCAVGGDLIIGTPTATTSTNGSYFPTQTYYNYSYTQQLFDVTEIVADTIFGVGFQYFFATPESRNITIYLGHTTQSTFTGIANFIPLDSMMIVYQGPVPFTNVGEQNWVNINFTTPFDYDNVNNLVLAVRDMTGTYTNSGDKFRTHSVTGNKGIYFYQDGGAIDPVNPSALSSGVSSFRSNTKFILPCQPATCIQPNVILTDVTSDNADMIIVPGASETSWEAEYKIGTQTTWIPLGTVSTTTYSMPGLNSNTTYQVRFRTVCSPTESSNWKTVTFTTDCGTIIQLPFIETFDTYGQGSNIYPTCWVRNSTYGANPYITTTYPVSTPHSMYFYSSGTTYSMIVLPPLDPSIGIDSLQLSFWGRISTAGHNLMVGVMTNPNDASTFTLVGTVAPGLLNTYEELTVSFANYTDTGRYIAIRSDLMAQNLYSTMYIDNLSLGYIPNCVKPTDILFTNIMQTTATGFWTPSATAVSYEVVYGLPGVDPLTATPIAVNDTFYDMSGLTANTLYHFYVRSVCAGGEYSDWTFVRTFRTACDAITTLPWTDYFDTYGTGTLIFPQCWTRNTTQTDRPYITGTNFSAPGSMYFYAGTAGAYNIAATPMFDASIPINTLKANFKYRVSNLTDTLYVGVMTDPLNAATFVQIAAIGASATAAWQDKEVFFSSYTGTGQYIAFKAQYNTTYVYGYLDNLEIMDIPTCPRPTLATVSNITSTSMDLDWTENGSATEWEIEYGPAGFTQGTGTYLPASVHPINIPSLTPSTSYDFYIRAICSVGDTSYWSNKVVGVTACVPITTLPWSEGFETITAANQLPNCWAATSLGNYTYTQIVNYGSYNRDARTGTGAAYFRYGANDRFFTPGFQLTAGVTYDFSYWYVTDGYTGWNTLELAAYSGQTAGTLVQSLNTVSAPVNTTYTQVNASFTPTTSDVYYFGIYCQASGVPWYLTFDDLSLTAQVVTCALPTNLAVSAINTNNATATWTAGGTETQWELAYKATAASTWTSVLVNTTPSQLISSLTAGTDYDVKVRAICAPGDTSAWTPIVNFTTSTVSCNAPTNLAAGSLTNNGATITWTAGGTETSWEVDYKLASATTWTTVTATSASQVLTGLTICSNYNVRVRAVCGVGIYSSYTAVVNFSTLSPVPTNLQVTNITDQSALATWTAGGSETSWSIEYKLVSSANWTTATVNGTPSHPLTGLQSNSQYEVRVKSLCSPNESVFTPVVTFTTLGMTFTITATSGPNGTITPSGTITVNQGANQTFTFEPHNTYQIDVITIDGIAHTSTPTSYTFTNVMGNHTIHVDFAQGIDENELAQLVELFPNPTSSAIELRLKSDHLHVKECKIYDMYGKLMRTIPIHAETTSIDVTDFASGVYFVRMESERGTISKKFVKK